MSTALFITILGASALLTSFVSGILGMAGGMILMGVLLALMPLPAAMMLHGITQFSSNLWRALLWRQSVDWRIFRGYVLGALLATAAFAFLHLVASKPWALIAMGFTPFVSLALPEKLHLNVERRGHSAACGAICTAISLTAGVAGPILDVFFVRSKMTRHAIISTKATTQGFAHLLKTIYFGLLVATSTPVSVDPWIAALMVALAFIGTSLSAPVLKRMDDASFRFWSRWTIGILGAVYMASGVLLLLGQ